MTHSYSAGLRDALARWGTPRSIDRIAERLIDESYEQIMAEAQNMGHGNMLLTEGSYGGVELFIVEGETSGPTKFRGKFQEANAQNKNKREYPFEVLDANLKRLMETIKARGLIGELDHPTDSIIHFEKASHVITDLWWEGNVLMGEGEILPTPHGKILENIIKAGVRVGISSRGVGNGSTRPSDGVLVIGESYKLITFDAVADPSTFSAYQKMVSSTPRRESVASQPIVQDRAVDAVVNSKNEATGIYKDTNANALIAYGERHLRNLIKNLKSESL